METDIQNENCLTVLESFPNELFVQIFSYLTSVDTIIAFSNLNNRFQCLVFTYCQTFDLISINKKKCDFIFQFYETNQWKSLRIPNNDQRPFWIDYFMENYFSIKNFSQLQTLSMGQLNDRTQQLFFSLLPSLTNLISLSIDSLCGKDILPFDLPKLQKLIFGSCENIDWIKNFSRIETIEYTLNHFCEKKNKLIWPLIIKNLKIVFLVDTDYSLILDSLVHLSQLITLEIYEMRVGKVPLNGQRWEDLIRSSFPLLKTFKFYFIFRSLTSQKLKRLVASYSTPFYIKEKQWFVYCNIFANSKNNRYGKLSIFYTLPYPMETLTIYKNSFKKTISNLPINNHLNIYTNIKTLIFENYIKPNHDFNKTKIINLVINTQFESIYWLHALTKLEQLHIDHFGFISMEQFQILLDNTPYLYSLSLRKSQLIKLTDNWNDVHICNHLSQKIRVLKLHSYKNPLECLNRHELERILSIFETKCEYLSLGLQTTTNTIDYTLSRMSALNYLHIFVREKFRLPITKTLTMEWLEKQQAQFNNSNCIIINNIHGNYFWL
ncbi:unnamed protein product [Rotaria sp. Silwood1]|nr:unnamed protein product [Rotaria sp. Silwood1]CAF4982310.1 unnamed protein product [Rotaria sp. Silwood1]